MNTTNLLKQDFVQGMMSRPTRAEAEVLANRVVDLMSDMIHAFLFALSQVFFRR